VETSGILNEEHLEMGLKLAHTWRNQVCTKPLARKSRDVKVVEKAEIDCGWMRPLPEEAFTYGYQAEMKHFVECARDWRQPRETYEHGLIVNWIPEARYRSMREKSRVPVRYEYEARAAKGKSINGYRSR
jgi:hypothetical protein